MDRRALLLALGALPLCSTSRAAGVQALEAEDAGPAASGIEIARDSTGVMLTAHVPWQLPDMVQEALMNGIPVHFVVEASITRERWYWRDEQLLHAQRYMRLSYQPLTRRWRLYTGSAPFDGKGLGLALASAYERLDDALAVMQRLVGWRIGDPQALPTQGPAVLLLRFRIDVTQFPRALQIGTLGRADWNVLAVQSQRLHLETLG